MTALDRSSVTRAAKRAELHVVEARGRVSDQSAKIARLKSRGESSLEAEQDLKRTF